MALVLDDPQLEQLAYKLADRKKLNVKDVFKQALLNYLLDTESDKRTFDELQGIAKLTETTSSAGSLAAQIPVTGQLTPEQQKMFEDAMRIARHCASLPVLDNRSEDEILGYNEFGCFD